jgi:hypothetical protein
MCTILFEVAGERLGIFANLAEVHGLASGGPVEDRLVANSRVQDNAVQKELLKRQIECSKCNINTYKSVELLHQDGAG